MHMHRFWQSLFSVLMVVAVIPPGRFPPGPPTFDKPVPPGEQGGVRVPFYFEANQGQANPDVRFVGHGSGYRLSLTTDSVWVTFQPTITGKTSAQLAENPLFTLTLVGANPASVVVGENQLPGVSNYFIGSNPASWRTNIPHYERICYGNVYPGVDLRYEGDPQLHQEFIIAPGADLTRIRLRFVHSGSIDLDSTGNLLLHTRDGVIHQLAPLAYQEMNGERVRYPTQFVLQNDLQVGFAVPGYNRSQALIIRTPLVDSRLQNGKGSDVGRSITVDGTGAVYVTGTTSSSDFPTTSGSVQPAFGDTSDVFVAKFDPSDHHLIYSTYLGGSGADAGYSIKVDKDGAVYVTGDTTSPDFPATPGAYQASFGGASDAFVTKLNPAGNALVYSTYLGGREAETAHSLAIGSDSAAYVTGQTASLSFPTTPGAYQGSLAGASDVFVSKLDAAGHRLVYSTYLGGRRTETGYSIKIDPDGAAYIAGDTASANFPTTPGTFQRSLGGASDAFVTKLDATGSRLVYSTYLGGTGADTARSLALDANGIVYITGDTASANFPTTSDAYRAGFAGTSDVFITVIDTAGTALRFSTYLGGTGADTGYSIALDNQGLVYITGQTSSADFPATSGAYQTELKGASDAFAMKLNGSTGELIYSTYVGGNNEEVGRSIALDSHGTAFITGETASPDFPISSDAYQTVFGGASDAFMTEISPSGTALIYSTLLGGK